MTNYSLIKFDWDLLMNPHNKIEYKDSEYYDMDEEEIDEYNVDYYESEKKVLFDGIELIYDYCDCNSCCEGYATHGRFVYELKIDGYDICSEVDEEIWIENKKNGRSARIEFNDSTTIQDFIDMLIFLKIDIKLRR